MTEKTKLSSGPEKTATWIWLEQGMLKVEYYDFSEEAQRFFGNDIGYTLTITETKKLCSISNQAEESIVQWLANCFNNYFEIKKWLENNKIGFHVETENWA